MSNLYLDFAVNGMYLARKNRPPLVDGSFKFIFARFEFSKEWENAYTFVLASRDNETYTVLVENNEAEIPYEAIRTAGTFEIQLIGNRGETRMATNPVAITIASSEMANNPSGEETRLTSDFLITTLAGVKAEADNAKISELNADAYANRAKTEADKAEQISAKLPDKVAEYIETNKDKLKGEKGDAGAKGDKGDSIVGPMGPQGPQGIQGVAGKDGVDGKDGEIPAEQFEQIQANTEAINQQSGEITTLNGRVETLENAEIPIATQNKIGGIKWGYGNGMACTDAGVLYLYKASNTVIDQRASNYQAIVSSSFDYAVKQAMCDGKGAAWTEEEKAKARERMGVAIVTLTQAEYDALEVKSPDTTYLVLESD